MYTGRGVFILLLDYIRNKILNSQELTCRHGLHSSWGLGGGGEGGGEERERAIILVYILFQPEKKHVPWRSICSGSETGHTNTQEWTNTYTVPDSVLVKFIVQTLFDFAQTLAIIVMSVCIALLILLCIVICVKKTLFFPGIRPNLSSTILLYHDYN